MRSTKKSLIMSMISLILCFAMLLGSTWAWFTDEVTSGTNKIVAGNLDVELYHATSGAVTADDANKVTSTTQLFNIAHWEPGVVAYENFMVKNAGNLALKYQLAMTVGDFNKTTDGDHTLKEVLKVAVVPGGFSGDRAAAQALTNYQSLDSFSVSSEKSLLPNTTGDTFGVVIYWQPNVMNDNDYNLNNGKTATTTEKFTDPKVLGIELGVKLTAQQLPHEEDSFDKFYDKADNEVVATWSGESQEATIPTSGAAVTMQVMEGEKVHAEATVEAGTKVKTANDNEAVALNESETLKLTIEPDGTPNGITVQAGNSVTTYDVSLIKVVTTTQEGGGETKTTAEIVEADTPVLVSLDIGVVDLQKFYHHGTELTKANNQNSVDTDKYYYDETTGMIYFKTKSFSPFASVYKFAGGLGTSEYPYLLGNEQHFLSLKEGFTTTTESVNFKFLNDMDMGKDSIQSLKGQTWSRDRWFDVMYDSTVIHLDMNGKTIDNLDCFLFAGIQNLEMKNGIINFINGTNEPGIIYYVSCGTEDSVDYHRNLTFKDLTLNGTYEANMSHYGPVIAQSYGGSFENDTVLLENVVSNVNINNVAGGAYTGGMLGYVYGPISVKNCVFNGMIQSPYAGGFINPMAQGTVTNENNAFNGKLLATNTVQKFGHGSDTVASVGEGASASKVTVSNSLLVSVNMGEEIKINHSDSNITRYAVSIMVWTNEATNTTVFDVNVPASEVGTIATGLYKNYFENSETDGSTAQTRMNSGWYDGCIWKDDDTYKVYCSSSTQVKTSSNATIYVYGYNAEGNIVTYQTQSYSPAKSAK